MDSKKAIWTGAAVAGGAVTLCCVAPLALIPLALVTVAAGLRAKFGGGKTAENPVDSTVSGVQVETSQSAATVNHG